MGLVQHFPALTPPSAPVCSVCIANYNGVALLADCLESVLAQLGGFSIEIIVHDDASTDGSVSWLRANYPQIELLASEQNTGFCVSNNRMVERARGKYVLLLNNDAALLPDALLSLLETASAQDAPGILTLPQYDWTSGKLVDRGCGLDLFYNPVPNIDPTRHEVAMVIGACMFLPRELWIDLGGFPAWFGSIGEDLYLCCLARLRGFKVQAVAASGYRHRQGTSFGGNRAIAGEWSTTFRRRRLSERNKSYALVIFTPTLLLWPLLACHLASLLLEGVVLTLIHRDRRILLEIYVNTLTSLLDARKMLCARRTAVWKPAHVGSGAYLRAFSLVPRKLVMLARLGIPRITR